MKQSLASDSTLIIQINKPNEQGGFLPTIIMFPIGSGFTSEQLQIDSKAIKEANTTLNSHIQRMIQSYDDNLAIGVEENNELLDNLLEAGRSAFEDIIDDDVIWNKVTEKLRSADAGTTIIIMLDRQRPVLLPWELLAYNHGSEDPAYRNLLGIRHIICRQALSSYSNFEYLNPNARPRLVLLPHDDLPSIETIKRPYLTRLAAEEKRITFTDFSTLVSQAPEGRRLRRFRNELTQEHLGIADFACRVINCGDERDSSTLRISLCGDMELDTNEIRKALTSRHGRNAPFFLLNLRPAAGSKSLEMSHLDAFRIKLFELVDMFLELGAGGVIATHCVVPDRTAATFATMLYKNLVSGSTIAAAMRQTRKDMLQTYQNPLGLVYELYVHPDRILFIPAKGASDGFASAKNKPPNPEVDKETPQPQEVDMKLQETQMEKYVDFDLRIAPDGHAVASSIAGQATADIPTKVPDLIAASLDLINKRQTDADQLKLCGRTMYDWLFPKDIHTQLNLAEALAKHDNAKLRIRLQVEAQEIASLPLEFTYREIGSHFMAINPDTVLSRYLNLRMPPDYVRRREGPLHMLAIIADPIDQTRLPPSEWKTILEEALAIPLKAGDLVLHPVERATRREIRNALLEQKPDIIQFVGHGIYEDGKGHLALVDENTNKTWLVDDETFADLFLGHSDHLGLISLATCESAKSDDPQGFLGIAPKLVERNVPAVLAMQYKVYIKTAKIFLEDFYTSVAARKPIDWATQSARNAVRIELGVDNREFATPVLFMRAKDGNIF